MGRLSVRRQWWLVIWGLLHAAAICVVLVALYFVLPLDRLATISIVVELSIGIALLSAMVAWQLHAIIRSEYPAIRATQGLAVVVPLFLLLFAATYYILGRDDPETFTEPLTRSDALYFTVTVFSTVGFGDIAARGEIARWVVTVQILLDLVVLGLGIHVILGAVRRGRSEVKKRGPGTEPSPEDPTG